MDSVAAKTVFENLLESDLPQKELTFERLKDEASGLCGAAIETTQWALTVALYHIVANPPIHKRLRQELIDCLPEVPDSPSLTQLYRLPYLMACIEEGRFFPVFKQTPVSLFCSLLS